MTSSTDRRRPALLVLAYLAFVSLGLPDSILGVAWPSLRESFALPQALLGAPLASAATTYFLSGLLAGRLMRAMGVGGLLAGSTLLVTLGVSGYASAPIFIVFLIAACIVGFGSGAIDSGLNSYAAHHFGARHMTWLHAAYSAGAALGPVIMTAMLARGAGWRAGYTVIGVALGLLAVAFVVTRRQWSNGQTSAPVADSHGAASVEPAQEAPSASSGWSVLRSSRVWLQIVLFFVYTGVEVTAGQWSYTVLVEARGVDPTTAGAWVSFYWASLLAGRVVLGFIVERVGTVRLLRFGTVVAVMGALLFAAPGLPVWVGAIGLGVLGFALAPIFPGLMAETPRRVGATAAPHAVGFQVSAGTAGVAVVPSVAGLLGEKLGLVAIAPWIAVCAVLLLLLHEGLIAKADRGPPTE
ncbi:MFS transporter [Hyalangium rubrum]|uniref:MFS transporter n=1 Tax=Hyalangium rubrum TaxID=3103134 RepID=A0ABU5H903_9BACT|nr:MFS transporter [Hyalangium sp. s54d21]MDY7229334.1 MFS transporter [Hyalangium sp. s54d21]